MNSAVSEASTDSASTETASWLSSLVWRGLAYRKVERIENSIHSANAYSAMYTNFMHLLMWVSCQHDEET